MTLNDHLLQATSLALFVDGKESILDLDFVQPELTKLLNKSYFSPALAVAKNNEIYTNIRNGYWLEFRYDTPQSFADMNFDKLLVELKPKMYGFNLIRGNIDEYSGRCYYLNLNCDTTKFYNFLVKLA